MILEAVTPMHHLMPMGSSAAPAGGGSAGDGHRDTEREASDLECKSAQ